MKRPFCVRTVCMSEMITHWSSALGPYRNLGNWHVFFRGRSQISCFPRLRFSHFKYRSQHTVELVVGFHFIRRLINAKVMKDWDMHMTNRQLPECAHLGNFTESYIHCHLRYITLSGGSPVGTCRIGAEGDPSAVVDPLLR